MGRRKIYSTGIYARLSVDSQNEKNESIQNQIEIARAFLEKQQDMILFDCYSDLGKTGTDFRREGFNRLMADVRLRKVDCIIVKDFSRFGRNYIETGNYIQKIFPFLGVRFIAVADRFDSLYANGDELGVNLKNLANEMYARDISLKVKSAKRVQWEKGSYAGGTPPYGYRAEQAEGKRYLMAEQETASIVRALFEMYASGKSMKDLILWLYGKKVHSPKSYRRYGHALWQEGEELLGWTAGTVKFLLTNPVYMGHLVQGQMVKENVHEAIVSKEQFFRVAERFERQAAYSNKKDCAKTAPREEDIFAGLLFCGECGKRMKRVSHVRERGQGERTKIYGYCCPGASTIGGPACERKYITCSGLIQLLKTALRQEAVLTGLCPDKLIEQKNKTREKSRKEKEGHSEQIKRQIESRERKVSEQYLKYRGGRMDREEFLHRKEEEERIIGQLKERQKEEAERLKEQDKVLAGQNYFLRTLIRFDEKSELSRELMAALIEQIRIFSDKRIEIIFRFGRKQEEKHLFNTGGDTL